MRLTSVAMRPAHRTIAWCWQQRRLTTAAATLTECGIHAEAAARQLLAPMTEPKRPVVSWHLGGSGQPLVLLNGFTGSGLAWPTTLIAALEEHHQVIRIDNRGTGWSRHAPTPFTIGDMADDVCDVLDALGLDRATILGYSMGGMIAQEVAVRHPDRVERLVLCSTIPPIPHVTATAYGIAMASQLLNSRQPADDPDPSSAEAVAAANLWLRFAARDFKAPPELVEEIGLQALRRITPWRSVVAQARAIQSWRGGRRLATITAPTLIVYGAADRVIIPDNALTLHHFIPGSTLTEVPKAGHLLPWEAGEQLVELVGA